MTRAPSASAWVFDRMDAFRARTHAHWRMINFRINTRAIALGARIAMSGGKT